jgi:thiamine-phosphate pyrophosphorylase
VIELRPRSIPFRSISSEPFVSDDPSSAERERIAGVYLLTPDADDRDFERVLSVCEAALAVGVSLIQYRNKFADRATRVAQASRLVELAHAAGALAIVNDDVELALEVGAAGAHLGRDDGDLSHARARLGTRLLGASCYDDLERAARAVAARADAIAFGSIYASSTKPAAVRAPLSLLGDARRAWPATRIIAIGGIDAGNIAAVAAAGAHAAALMAAVFDAADPAAAARSLVQQFDEGRALHESQRKTV